MAVRRTPAIILAFGLMAFAGCSKTQDTAPENRIFGSPPIIQTVDVQTGTGNASCDITPMTQIFLCSLEPPLHPNQYNFTPSATVDIDISYSETIVKAHIVDPEDPPPPASDILLATTSYQPPPALNQTPEEISLLMFDDGQANKFPYKQIVPGTFDTDPSAGDCAGLSGTYDLTADDLVAGDHIFTRGFGFVAPGSGVGGRALDLLSDCVAKVNHQFPTVGANFIGKPFTLKIEAVDREGNLTTWPLRPTVTPVVSTFSCAGQNDQCACCLMTSNDPSAPQSSGGCKGLPGVNVTDPSSGWPPGGFCENLP